MIAPRIEAGMQIGAMVDETCLAHANFDLRADLSDGGPPHTVGALRQLDRHLPLERARDTLERLCARRRLARLWHRYLLTNDITAECCKWRAAFERQTARIDAHASRSNASRNVRDRIMRRNGSHHEGCRFAT